MKILFFLLTVLILKHVKTDDTVVYQLSDGSGQRTCIKRTDDDPCPPDHQIEICGSNFTKLQCIPCRTGLRQCDKTTSALSQRCYDPASFCSMDGDNVVVVRDLPSGGCNISCRCNEAGGYTGSNEHHCIDNKFTCPPTQTRSIPGGDCYPCPDGYHNPWEDGVDKCIKIKVSGTPPIPAERNRTEIKVRTTSSKPEVDRTSQPAVINNSSKPGLADVIINNNLNIDRIDGKSTDTVQWVVIGIVCLVIVVAAIAARLYCCYLRGKRRRKKPDHDAVELGGEQAEAMVVRTAGPSGGNGGEGEENEESLEEPLIQHASGGYEPSVKLDAASKPLPSSASIASKSTGELDDPNDQLYKLIKQPFCCRVDPQQLLPYLDCCSATDERIGEIQVSKGRSVAAQELLIKLVRQVPNWSCVVCRALRNYDVGLSYLADTIEEKQRELSPLREELPTGPQAIVCQEVGPTQDDLIASSIHRKQLTKVKEIDE